MSYLFRSLGSVVGLSVGSTLVQGTLRYALQRRISGEDVNEVCFTPGSISASFDEFSFLQIIKRVRESLKSIDELSPTLQAAVRGSYDEAIHVTFYFAVAMAACGLLASIFIKEKSLAQRN